MPSEKKYGFSFLILLFLLISGCGSQSVDEEKEKFEAYLTFKRIPLNDEVRYQRLREEYNKRANLVVAIEATKTLDLAQIDAEVEAFRQQLVVSRYFDDYLKKAVTSQGVQNFYSENIADYRSRKAHVAHILFRVNPKMGEPERQALLTAAGDAYSKINSGESFADIAKLVSDDKVSAAKGGDLGWINEGAISEKFSQKVFSMKTGEVSEPFLTDYGFHIVKVLEEPQQVTKPLESVKGDIRYRLRNQSKQAETERLLKVSIKK